MSKNQIYNVLTGIFCLTMISGVWGTYHYKINDWRPFQTLQGVYKGKGFIDKIEFINQSVCNYYFLGIKIKTTYEIKDGHLIIKTDKGPLIYEISDGEKTLTGGDFINKLTKSYP